MSDQGELSARRKATMRYLPFADIASDKLPLQRILRLSLFQVSVGMAAVLLTGTLNRVMIVELSMPAWIVSLMVALPLVFAPLRALIGHRSDRHVSVFGWRRGPYIWFGSLFQFGGLAIMPFALLVMSGMGEVGGEWIGFACAAAAFLLVGAGMHTVQTAGLALATDIAPQEVRPRVVALLYVRLLVGMAISSLIFGLLLTNFSQFKLIQLIQSAAVVTMVLNTVALWKQEGRGSNSHQEPLPEADFWQTAKQHLQQPGVKRLMAATGLGAAAFSMQDILLEPYGGEILGMSVSGTTMLTAIFAVGSILGFTLPTRLLANHGEPHRIAGLGALAGVIGFSLIVLSSLFSWTYLFISGVGVVGIGGGLFAVCTLIAGMAYAEQTDSGIALGVWGAVQASCAGIAIALGGVIRDVVSLLGNQGWLGKAAVGPLSGYVTVYTLEVFLLFAALIAIGPLAKHALRSTSPKMERLEIQAFPN